MGKSSAQILAKAVEKQSSSLWSKAVQKEEKGK